MSRISLPFNGHELLFLIGAKLLLMGWFVVPNTKLLTPWPAIIEV